MIKYILKEQEIVQLMGKTIVLLFMKFQNVIKLIKIKKIQILCAKMKVRSMNG